MAATPTVFILTIQGILRAGGRTTPAFGRPSAGGEFRPYKATFNNPKSLFLSLSFIFYLF